MSPRAYLGNKSAEINHFKIVHYVYSDRHTISWACVNKISRLVLADGNRDALEKIKAHRDPLSGAHRRGWTCERLQIEAILWICCTGAPLRDLPAAFGPWKTN